jgi:D-amino-acid oxidase
MSAGPGDVCDAAVIGAGVVGLAIAEALSAAGLETLVLEAQGRFGQATSSRNSEVIHAGLYYPAGSLKHRTCIAGRELLYRFCRTHGVAHRQCGKLIVASSIGLAGLEALAAAAEANGVPVELLDRSGIAALEPAVAAAAGLLSPATGIVDAHGLMQALLGKAEAQGAMLVCHAQVTRVAPGRGGWRLWIAGEDELPLTARWVVNAAGLGAQQVSRAIEGMAAVAVPPLRLARGRYCAYEGAVPFRRLIYPLPEPGGLGIHLTLDLAGQARFGPDVEWVDAIDYSVTGLDVAAFARAVGAWWPGLDPSRMAPGYAGVRPKLSGPGEPNADFMIHAPADHGLPGIIALYGIESPGLTAALALAEIVRDMVREGDG